MRFTLEVRSAAGELWYLRAMSLEFIQEIIRRGIALTEAFQAGGYKIIIRPYNEATDHEKIGDLDFLGKGEPNCNNGGTQRESSL